MNEKLRNIDITQINGISKNRKEAFTVLGINNVWDLLNYFPFRYIDRTNILTIPDLVKFINSGENGEVTVFGEVIKIEDLNFSKRKLFKLKLKGIQGVFECVWFQGISWIKKNFKLGDKAFFSGKAIISKYNTIQIPHPDYDILSGNDAGGLTQRGQIIPVYSITKELKDSYLGMNSLREIIKGAVSNYFRVIQETLPDNIVKKNNLLSKESTIVNIHSPSNNQLLEKAFARLKYEELFYFEILIALRKKNFTSKVKNKNTLNFDLVREFLKTLPFELTQSQKDVLVEIYNDLQSDKPMNRLLQGDVGSGKTIVALLAILSIVGTGRQAVLMAPTEILAKQHFRNFGKLLKGFDVELKLVVGGMGLKEKRELSASLLEFRPIIAIGTHALFEENIRFADLGIVVIDEQHRFGVKQRADLINKADFPDVLLMTATPIPRTLTLSIYGDLDTSVINEYPKSRKRIITALRGEKSLSKIFHFVKDKIKEGNQCYIVYPLVEESEKLDLKAATEEYEFIKSNFSEFRTALIHGKLHWEEKDKVMQDFANGLYDILVATTVIEVGIDVKNANIILINEAHRFGLSQLHQLRGRVGRGTEQGYCILITEENSAESFMFSLEDIKNQRFDSVKMKTKIRLNALVNFWNGFDLSEIDLLLRGPGDIFGTNQSGVPELKFADLTTDLEILKKAKYDAFEIVDSDPNLIKPENKIIMDILNENYKKNLFFAGIA